MPQPTIANETAGLPGGADPVEAAATPPADEPAPSRLVEADLLVEEVSIDGMCGVY